MNPYEQIVLLLADLRYQLSQALEREELLKAELKKKEDDQRTLPVD